MPSEFETQIARMRIFVPDSVEQRDRLTANGNKFVHYTTAEAAMSIIRNGEVWMRNAACMSDYSEIDHGVRLMRDFFGNADGAEQFRRSVEGADFLGAMAEAIRRFDEWFQHIQSSTFITCISEHDTPAEDVNGRLSMWRATARRGVGVALVVNPEPFMRYARQATPVYSSPVLYQDSVSEAFNLVAQRAREQRQLLVGMSRDDMTDWLIHVFLNAAICSKHPGFSEEREWRVIHLPNFQRPDQPTPLESTREVIGGVPQFVYKIPLETNEDLGLHGVELDTFLYRLIIGPSDYPVPIWQAFVQELTDAGVSQANERVIMSEIPLRTEK